MRRVSSKKYKAKRTKARKKINPRQFFIIFSVFLFLGLTGVGSSLLYNWLKDADVFRLRNIEIKGNNRLSRIDIMRVANATVGTSLLGFDTEKAEAALKAHNWIDNAKIVREFPDKLIISIKEREPVAVLNAGGLYLVDKKGVVFDVLGKHKVSLPIISGISKSEVVDHHIPRRAMSAIHLLSLAGKGAKLLSKNNISEIRLDGNGEMLIYTRDRAVPVRVAVKHLKRDLERAEKVLFHLYNSKSYQKVAEIDMEYGPNEAWVKLKGRR